MRIHSTRVDGVTAETGDLVVASYRAGGELATGILGMLTRIDQNDGTSTTAVYLTILQEGKPFGQAITINRNQVVRLDVVEILR